MKNHFKYWIIILIAILIFGGIVFMHFKSKATVPSQPVGQTHPIKKRRIRITRLRPSPTTPPPTPAPVAIVVPSPTPVPVPKPTPPPAPKPTPQKPVGDEVEINNHELMVEIAETDATRAQGLSGRAGLPANDGMLFIFQTPDMYAFWMKDMSFALDLIWIYQGKIIQITPNVPAEPGVPDEQLHNYLPPNVVDSVLEVDAGWAAKNDIQAGDSVVDQF